MTIEQNQRCAINYLNELKASTSGYAVNWLDMAIQTLEQQLSDDCISREEAIGIVARIKEMHIDDREQYPINYGTICDIDLALQHLPSVTPQPKVGKWIDTGSGQECSECGEIQYGYDSFRKYCPNCGAKMEVEE